MSRKSKTSNESPDFADNADQKTVLAALRETEERFRLLMENAEDYAIIFLDAEGSITSWNVGAERILGWTKTEVVGQPGHIIFTAEDRAAQVPEKEMASASEKGQAKDERWHLRKGGSRFYALGELVALYDDAGNLCGYAKLLRDLTDRRLAEHSLHESRREYEALIWTSAQIVWETDAEGAVSKDSPTWREYTGQSFDEWKGFGWANAIHPEDRERVRSEWLRHVRSKKPLEIEYRLRHNSGEWRWTTARAAPLAGADGSIERWVGMNADINERKRAESHLALLAEVSDLTRRIEKPEELLSKISQTIGKHLDVKRCLFNEIDLTRDLETIHRDYCAEGIESVAGVHRISDYSSVTSAEMIAGETVVNHDSKLDERTAPDYDKTYEQSGERAYVAVPLTRENRWVASLWVSTDVPRRWNEQEVSLLETVAERTWTAIEKLRVDRALRESEERLRLALDISRLSTFEIDLETDAVQTDATGRHIYGFTADEPLTFTKVQSRFHPDDKAEVLRRVEAAFAPRGAGEFEVEQRIVRTDGAVRWIRVLGRAIFAGAGEARRAVRCLGTYLDITADKQAEQALRESEESYRILAETASDAIIRIDEDSRIRYVNQAAERVFGYAAEEMLDQSLTMLMPEQMRELHHAGLGRYLRTGKRKLNWESIQVPAQHKSGQLFPLEISFGEYDLDGKRFFIGIARDISERKAAEENLRDSEEKFRMLADNISQLAWMTDADGWIFWYNKRWYDYTGTTFDEMQGWGWQAVHAPEEIERVTEKFKQHLESGEIWEDTFPLKSKTGEFRWFLSRALPIRDASGKIVRWFGTNTDVEEIRRARLQAEQANRLKDEFLATVSHELRTPLNAILGWSAMLQSNMVTDEMRSRADETIYRSAKAQAQLIEDLLDVSRIITGKMRLEPRPVQLGSIVASAIHTLRPAAAAKSIRLESNLEGEPYVISGDTQRLQQVIWNLLSNAVKFTPDGGTVEIVLKRDATHASLIVKDTGKGIEPEFLPFMFERFRQEDASSTRRHGGLGLGLAIVRHLVELHGGTISVESQGANHGSTFTVRLPLLLPGSLTDYAESNGHPRNLREALSDGFLPNTPTPKRLTNVRVLLVDDEHDALEMLDAALTGEGARVRAASSAQEAFEIFADWKPDVLVSDIAMPDEDGYSLIRRVRELAPGAGGATPAIAMTAYVRVEDRIRVLQSGFQMYVPKARRAV